MPKLSIIIPVYQVEDTLERCVESVLKQEFDDYELLLVDDGSTDRSGQLCGKLAERDGRIKVFHKPNGGLSDARNYALDRCKGLYITFIDSDDTIADNTLQPLMDLLLSTTNVDNSVDNHMENYVDKCVNNCVERYVDILEYSVLEHFGHPSKEHTMLLEDHIYDSPTDYILQGRAYRHSYAWNKIYRREVFESSGDGEKPLRFEKGRNFEDMFNLANMTNRIKRIQTTHLGMYIYHWNKNGITATANGNTLADLLDAHLRMLNILKTKVTQKDWEENGDKYQVLMAEYYAHVLNIQLDVFELTGRKPLLPVMNYKATMKEKLLQAIGMNALCRVNKLLHRFYRR